MRRGYARQTLIIPVLVALIVAAFPGPAPAARSLTRAIVSFSDHIDRSTVAELERDGLRVGWTFPAIDVVAVAGTPSAVAGLAERPGVRAVHPDRPVEMHGYIAKRDTRVTQVHAGRGLSRRYTGDGISVGVVDTGIETGHPDLSVAIHLDLSASWALDDVTGGTYSTDLAERPVGLDPRAHGTQVAGIIAGNGVSARGADMRGVAPGATVIDFAVDGPHAPIDNRAYESNVIAAYQWVLDHRHDPRFPPLRVVNNSWGLSGPLDTTSPLVRIIRQVVRSGVVVVFSAGNYGPAPNTVPLNPNSLDEVITVGATCKSDHPPTHQVWGLAECGDDRIWDSSSRGPAVDVVAPGVFIWTTMAQASETHIATFEGTGWGSTTGPAPGDHTPSDHAWNLVWYVPRRGTSFSAPHVAGIAALMLEANPRLSPARVERILERTARDGGPSGFDDAFGWGIVDARRAVREAERAR